MLKGDKKDKNSFTVHALNQNAPFSLILKKLDSLIPKLLLEVQMVLIQYMKGSANVWTVVKTDRECASRILEV